MYTKGVLKGAKFGDKFKTRSGKLAVVLSNDTSPFYMTDWNRQYFLAIESVGVNGFEAGYIECSEDGVTDNSQEQPWDIVSRWE